MSCSWLCSVAHTMHINTEAFLVHQLNNPRQLAGNNTDGRRSLSITETSYYIKRFRTHELLISKPTVCSQGYSILLASADLSNFRYRPIKIEYRHVTCLRSEFASYTKPLILKGEVHPSLVPNVVTLQGNDSSTGSSVLHGPGLYLEDFRSPRSSRRGRSSFREP